MHREKYGTDELLTVREAAELLDRSISTVYDQLQRGAWPFASKDGKYWMIGRAALLDHVSDHPLRSRRRSEEDLPRLLPRAGQDQFQALLERAAREAAKVSRRR